MTPTLLPQADIFERDFVSVDLETTGLNANADAIIEVGAVKLCGGVVLDRYQTFVNPDRPIPAFIQQLTSISPSQIERAPRFQQIAAQFAAFVGDLPIVGHNIAFDISFLASHGLHLANRSYNTWDLASIFLPTLAEYNLSALAKHLELDHSQAHRAVADAETTALVFHRLLKLGASYPAAKIAFIARAARTANAPVADLLEELVPHAAGANSAPGTPGAVGLNGLNLDGLAKRLSSDPGDQPGDAVRRALTEQQVEDLLAPHGVFANSFPGFEDRPQQAEMLKAVTRAIYQGRKLIVEGGTGIGKSIAYLLPAVLYSATHGHRVVISTNTISLQEQLMDKDIPAVISILEEAGILEPGAVRAAQLKGRSNYVCLRRWTSLGASDSLTEDEARVLGKTAVWLDDTENGDRTDLNLSFGDQRAWSRVCADNQGVCQSFRSGAPCFLRQARQRAEAANILVVNHALLLADLAVGGTVLQDYQHLVIDEAHHLEEEASRQLGFEIAEDGLPQELDSVYRLIRHLTAVANQSPEDEALGRARDALTNATAGSNQALQSWQQLWDTITRLYQSHSRGDNDRQPVSLELTVRQSREWGSVAREWESFSTFLSESVNRLTEVGRFVDQGIFDLSDDSQGNELIGAVDAISELNDRLASVFGRYDEEQIQWIDMVRRNVTLHSTPLSVGPILSERLFQQKDTVVLTSATLATDGNFGFLRQRLGFPDDCDELLVDSPFNYQRNTLLLVPDDLPDPRRGADHARGTAQVILNMAQALDGHLMALFTSHNALRDASFQVRGPLRASGINVLAQGIDGTPRQLVDRLHADPRSVLLGTASFWEGVDMESGVLRGLLLCRLPFPVPIDPIVKARGNLFNNPFNEYQVPSAVLRFRQGFGRLIRNKVDRGAVVILDRRIQTANYGDRFLNALPPCTVERSTVGSVGDQAARWLQLDRPGRA
jgi:DNA polymerase-3 subunit epsilon/ATP-dependent DNA helicase DinG